MKKFTKITAQALAAASFALSLPAMAQMSMDHSKMGMDHGKTAVNATSATPALADGEIRKIDKETGKITIKHGDIKHLDMPPMSMVFNVKDKALLDKVQVGDKIRFIVIMDAGKMVVTDIQPAK